MIKRLASYVREYRKDAILSPIFITLEVVLDIFIPLYMGRLIDYGIDRGDMSYVLKMGLLLESCVWPAWPAAPCPVSMLPLLRWASAPTCAMPCSIMCSPIRFPILINSPLLPSSPD